MVNALHHESRNHAFAALTPNLFLGRLVRHTCVCYGMPASDKIQDKRASIARKAGPGYMNGTLSISQLPVVSIHSNIATKKNRDKRNTGQRLVVYGACVHSCQLHRRRVARPLALAVTSKHGSSNLSTPLSIFFLL